MNNPLIGSRQSNYKYFYFASLTSICSFFILIYILAFIIYFTSQINKLIYNANKLLDSFELEIPYIKNIIEDKIEEICKLPNFTKFNPLNYVPNNKPNYPINYQN